MADLNNTIHTIEHCANGGYCNRCKLRDERKCDAMTSCKTLLTDALELLKEQHAEIEKLKNLVNYKKKLIEEYQKEAKHETADTEN